MKNDLIAKFVKGSVLENLPKLIHERDTFLKQAQTENKSSLVPSYSHEKLSVHQLQSVEWLADYSNVLINELGSVCLCCFTKLCEYQSSLHQVTKIFKETSSTNQTTMKLNSSIQFNVWCD